MSDMKAYPIDKIRNVVLAGHGGTGKTSLVEAMLFTAGTITRLGKVDDGSSHSDFDADEIAKRMSDLLYEANQFSSLPVRFLLCYLLRHQVIAGFVIHGCLV